MPPADTAALFCLSFTDARIVSTIILFRCGHMAPTHSKRLGLKHAMVHFRNTMIQVIHIRTSAFHNAKRETPQKKTNYWQEVRITYVSVKQFQGRGRGSTPLVLTRVRCPRPLP